MLTGHTYIFPPTQPIPRDKARQTNTQTPTPTTSLIYGKNPNQTFTRNRKKQKELLQQKRQTSPQNKKVLPFVIPYHPYKPNITCLLHKNWHLIEKDPILSQTFLEKPITAFTRKTNLRDLLERSHFGGPNLPYPPPPPPPPNPFPTQKNHDQ